ncbi:MAG: hypothetical protein ASUL_09174 [Candidatus Aramenus sulfurataquae]|uniref:HEAT repeat domain-containing protein n=2 Tax=Candidatus Aramenus sulfurataquae TaxID=1326980 RepID=W7KH11_9CREN|nr:MAG: hypothetical protein ASUL_09174 [Candidatus Aramenus sulfurataquae]
MDLLDRLKSKDREDKHKAWLEVEELVRSGRVDLLLDLLCFEDHGTRYRAWNLLSECMGKVSAEQVKEREKCLLELLMDSDLNVRRLVWYSTLPQVYNLLDKENVRKLRKYCEEAKGEEWVELLEETCNELDAKA